MSEKELRENRSTQVWGVKRAAGKPLHAGMGVKRAAGKPLHAGMGVKRAAGKPQHAGGVKRKERSASMACLQTKPIKREVRREREEKK